MKTEKQIGINVLKQYTKQDKSRNSFLRNLKIVKTKIFYLQSVP